MKLCRFELHDSPGDVRSGIFRENRVYETDGSVPIGVHDLSKLRFLSPVGRPPTLRLFSEEGNYVYVNPTATLGPLGEVDAIPGIKELGFEARIACIVKDNGENIDESESPSFLLGLTLLINFLAYDLEISDPTGAREFPVVVGPFLSIPDDENPILGQVLKASVKAGGKTLFEGEYRLTPSLGSVLHQASMRLPVQPGDALAFVPIFSGPLRSSPLGRSLEPGDSISVECDAFGMLVSKII